ncbi:hypothetical protein MY11210_005966 [Beauveria gryllotalpidicola]
MPFFRVQQLLRFPSANPLLPPTASSHISLREITAHNFRAVIDLDMGDGQRGNVSSNARSLCEAHYSPDAWVRAVLRPTTRPSASS